MRLINRLPKKFIGISVQMKDVIHSWCSKEVLELRQYEVENEQNWRSRGEAVVELGCSARTGRVSYRIPLLNFAPMVRSVPLRRRILR